MEAFIEDPVDAQRRLSRALELLDLFAEWYRADLWFLTGYDAEEKTFSLPTLYFFDRTKQKGWNAEIRMAAKLALKYGELRGISLAVRSAIETFRRTHGDELATSVGIHTLITQLRESPMLLAVVIQGSGEVYPGHRAEATTFLTGAVLSGTSLGSNLELLKALHRGHAKPLTVPLAGEMLSATFEAVRGPKPPATLRKLVNKAANIVEATEREKEKDTYQGQLGDAFLPPDEEDALARVLAREEARALVADVLDRARLSPRELVVFQLDSEGRTGREIAEELGIAVGTVKATLNHARTKMRAAAIAAALF